jgi:hypothetical protein
MTIPLAGAVGDLFNRLGKLGAVIANVRTQQNTQLTATTNTTTGVVAQYDAESDIQAIMGSSYISLLNGGASAYGSTMQSIARQTVNRMVFRDSPRLNQTLTSDNTLASLQYIIQQMQIQGATILAMTVAASSGSFIGVGNGVVNCSVKRPQDGKTLENSFAEIITLTCTQDSYIGGAVQGNEGFTATGQGNQGDFFAFNWPLGSNASNQLNAIDGNSDVSSGNTLTNSGFEEWTDDVPDNWELVVGTAGANINEETGIVYSGDASAAIIGNSGGTLTEIRQIFDSSSGTSGTLSPLTQYSFNIFLRRDGVASSTGVLTIELADSGNVTLNDQNGVANSFTIDLTALTTQFASYTGVFRTPLVLPSSVYLRIRLSTAYEDGRTFYMDTASLGIMTQLYTSGPYIAVHAGSTPFNENDYALITVTNSRGAAGTLSTFQTLLSRLFPGEVYGNELLFPSSATPTIDDATYIV